MANFTDKTALVTAGSAGIGAATVEAFAQQGANVMIADVNQTAGQAMADRLTESGYKAAFIHTDATDEEAMEAAIRKTVETFGGLHLAANIVGYAHPEAMGPEFHLQSVLGWDETFSFTLRSTFIAMKHEIAHMVNHGGGVICNVASLAGLLYVPDSGVAYGAAKTGVIRLTKFAAVNYADRGIRVNCIAPGTTPTEAFQKIGPGADALIAKLVDEHAIKRPIEPSEQAEAISWLCSDSASMITGHVLPVDGGWQAKYT